jgi:hypothetical protein
MEANYEHSTINAGMRSARCINVSSLSGPCSPEITQVQEQIDASMQAKARGVTTLPESTAAKMHHQPTASSMAAAEVEAGQLSPEESTAVTMAITRARDADVAGGECPWLNLYAVGA